MRAACRIMPRPKHEVGCHVLRNGTFKWGPLYLLPAPPAIGGLVQLRIARGMQPTISFRFGSVCHPNVTPTPTETNKWEITLEKYWKTSWLWYCDTKTGFPMATLLTRADVWHQKSCGVSFPQGRKTLICPFCTDCQMEGQEPTPQFPVPLRVNDTMCYLAPIIVV